MGIGLSEENLRYAQIVEEATDLRDGQAVPLGYFKPLQKLWEDPSLLQLGRGVARLLYQKVSFLLASPGGCDQCFILIEDEDTNQTQDAMTV